MPIQKRALERIFVSSGSVWSPILISRGDFKQITCPDGTPVFVIKNLDKAFPIFAKEWNATVGVVLNYLKDLAAKVGVDVKQKVVKIHDSLDQINGDLAYYYRMNYTTFMTRPCDQKSVEILREANEKVNKATEELRLAQLEVQRPSPEVSALENRVQELRNTVPKKQTS